jgi:hypothetical protein
LKGVLKRLNPFSPRGGGGFPGKMIKQVLILLCVSIASLYVGYYQSESDIYNWNYLVITQRIDGFHFEFCCNSSGNRFLLNFCPGEKQRGFDQANPVSGATVVQLKYLDRESCQDLTGNRFGYIMAKQ